MGNRNGEDFSFTKDDTLAAEIDKINKPTKSKMLKDTTKFLNETSTLVDFSKSILKPEDFDKTLPFYNNFFKEYKQTIAYYKSEEGKRMSNQEFEEYKDIFIKMTNKFKLEMYRILFFFAVDEKITSFGVEDVKFDENEILNISKKLGVETELVQIENMNKEIENLNKIVNNPQTPPEQIDDLNDKLDGLESKKTDLNKKFQENIQPFKTIMNGNTFRKSISNQLPAFKAKRANLNLDNAKELIETFIQFSDKFSRIPELEDSSQLISVFKEIKIKVEAPAQKDLAPIMSGFGI
jgi:hypothetical protein